MDTDDIFTWVQFFMKYIEDAQSEHCSVGLSLIFKLVTLQSFLMEYQAKGGAEWPTRLIAKQRLWASAAQAWRSTLGNWLDLPCYSIERSLCDDAHCHHLNISHVPL